MSAAKPRRGSQSERPAEGACQNWQLAYLRGSAPFPRPTRGAPPAIVRISQLSLTNFQCFGARTVIDLADFTVLIGPNGSGKSAVLEALLRLFGAASGDRLLTPDDFHVPPGERREDADERTLELEARLEFPELDGAEGAAAAGAAVPALFPHMTIRGPGETPYCRLRLVGVWTNTPTPGGDVESRYSWVTTPDGETPERLEPARARERSAVQVYYVPASRDTVRQLANVSGTLLNRLLSAISWDPGVQDEIEEAVRALRERFADLPAVQRIDRANVDNWRELHDDAVHSTPTLRFVAGRLSDVLRDTRVVFTPARGEAPHDLSRLSDGERSLFYFAFINTLFGIEREIYEAHHAPVSPSGAVSEMASNAAPVAAPMALASALTEHISYERLQPAPLTIFALEEPENHLGPHFLGRIVQQVGKIAANAAAQVLLTSHSTAVVSRVAPEQIRYLRCARESGQSSVRPITMPTDDALAAKYVREAVRAHPELYFARLVVLCEGDSEEVLLPKFAAASGAPLDLALVSVVPLGGRHVNHLWRLLRDLEIPHVTLLDLDRERQTGDWRTVRDVLRELRRVVGPEEDARLRTVAESGTAVLLDEDTFETLVDELESRAPGDDRLAWWVEHLRGFDVYFSAPLDLDFLLLRAFPGVYQGLAARGPQGLEGPGREQRIERAVHAVLGEDATGATYTEEERALFPWYSLLFLGHGKPTTHTSAWVRLTDAERVDRMPEPIRALLQAVRRHLRAADGTGAEHDPVELAGGQEAAGERDGLDDALVSTPGSTAPAGG